jgi:branched-chain amino acid transport system substrate-binding protein
MLAGAVNAQTVRIGQSLPLTGPLATYAQEKREGAQLAIDAANASGGIGGRRLELLTLDDGYLAGRAVANTRELEQRGVVALLGYLGVPAVEACLPLFGELKVPIVGLGSGSATIRTPFRRYVFPVRASYDSEAAKLVRHLRTIGVQRVAIVHHPDAFGDSGLAAYRKALADGGLSPTGVFSIDRQGDPAQSVAASLHALAPEAVLTFLTAKPAGALLKRYREGGAGGATFYSASIVAANQLSEAAGTAARGFTITQVPPVPALAKLAIVRDYLVIQARKGPDQRPSLYGIEAYIEARVLIEGLRRASGADRESLVRALETMTNFDLGGYPLNYTPARRDGSGYVDITVIDASGALRS